MMASEFESCAPAPRMRLAKVHSHAVAELDRFAHREQCCFGNGPSIDAGGSQRLERVALADAGDRRMLRDKSPQMPISGPLFAAPTGCPSTTRSPQQTRIRRRHRSRACRAVSVARTMMKTRRSTCEFAVTRKSQDGENALSLYCKETGVRRKETEETLIPNTKPRGLGPLEARLSRDGAPGLSLFLR